VSVIDHLVYAVSDLEGAADRFEHSTGVRPAYGGAHTGMGTHNALVSFGDSYLELIAPDPNQPGPDRPRPFGLDNLDGRSRLVTFAVRPSPGESIDALVAAARGIGFDPGDPVSMSRLRPDGVELHWRLTFPSDEGDGLIPFVIDWTDTENPSKTAPGGVDLVVIRSTHPDPRRIDRARAALGLADPVEFGDQATIAATVRGPAGQTSL
jgi:hypothetical protein